MNKNLIEVRKQATQVLECPEVGEKIGNSKEMGQCWSIRVCQEEAKTEKVGKEIYQTRLD